MITKKALIVDDSKLAQFVLKNMLVQYKLEVDTAESAEEALGYLSHQKPDVIFLDHTMPGMDGLQALKVIKSNSDLNTIPVMMYTSQSDSVYADEARALGAVDTLPKQLKPEELQQVLKNLHLIGDQQAVQHSTTTQKAQQFVAAKEETTTSEIEELSKLLREAESALEKETLKQFVQQELEKQHRRFTLILQKISHGLSELSHTKENLTTEIQSSPKNRMSNLLWPSLFVAMTLIFGVLYFQLQQSLSSLQQAYTDSSVNAGVNAVDQPSQPPTEIPTDNQINSLLKSLETAVNGNSIVSLEEPLFGKQSMERIVTIIAPLNNAGFRGEIQVVAHTGNFCLQSNVAGEGIIPAANTPIDQCQITESTATIKEMMTEEFRNFIVDVNSKDSSFYITLDARGGDQPLVDYPDIDLDTTAGDWNAIAQQNHRVEIIFKTER